MKGLKRNGHQQGREVLSELSDYEGHLQGILSRFVKSLDGLFIAEGDDPKLLRYVREIIELLHSALGKANRDAEMISAYYDGGKQNMYGAPSYKSVSDIIAVVQAVQTHIKRPSTALVQGKAGEIHAPMINEGRINELRALKSADFDFTKLIRLCEELNTVHPQGCYYSTAMVIRGMLEPHAYRRLRIAMGEPTFLRTSNMTAWGAVAIGCSTSKTITKVRPAPGQGGRPKPTLFATQ